MLKRTGEWEEMRRSSNQSEPALHEEEVAWRELAIDMSHIRSLGLEDLPDPLQDWVEGWDSRTMEQKTQIQKELGAEFGR